MCNPSFLHNLRHSQLSPSFVTRRLCYWFKDLPGIHDLRLTAMGFDSVKVDWTTPEQGTGLQGYWVKWETGERSPSLFSSSRFVSAPSLSTVLTHLNPTTRVCVSPVYRMARGEGLCCTTHTYTGKEM